MRLTLDEVLRRLEASESLQREGSCPLLDALYTLQEMHGVLPTDIEEQYGIDLLGLSSASSGEGFPAGALQNSGEQSKPLPSDPAGRRFATPVDAPAVPSAQCPEWLGSLLAPEEWFAEWWERHVPHLREALGVSAPETVERDLPLGTVPALFARPEGGAVEGHVDLFAFPRPSPDGLLSLVLRIPEDFSAPGEAMEVALVVGPSGRALGAPARLVAGVVSNLTFTVPADLVVTWREVGKAVWANLPLRCAVRRASPGAQDEPGNRPDPVIRTKGILSRRLFPWRWDLSDARDEVGVLPAWRRAGSGRAPVSAARWHQGYSQRAAHSLALDPPARAGHRSHRAPLAAHRGTQTLARFAP